MRFDERASAHGDALRDAWLERVKDRDNLHGLASLAAEHHHGKPWQVKYLPSGAFNIAIRIRFHPESSTVVKIPKPGFAMFPEEKTQQELSTMAYLRAHTNLKVPMELAAGTKADCPGQLGPFLIMEYVEYSRTMCRALGPPGQENSKEIPQPDPDVRACKNLDLYAQLANIVLELSKNGFRHIGTLSYIGDDHWEAYKRPLSMIMNELVQLGTLPRACLPKSSDTFATSSSYFSFLADLHMKHLIHQRNDGNVSVDEARSMFVARALFQNLAREGRLSLHEYEYGPFKLWCDDLRPSNILVDDHNQVTGVIDWEFTYAAPVEFTLVPPWWLLLVRPEDWPTGLKAWAVEFETRLAAFLDEMERKEDAAIQSGRLLEEQRLSLAMRHHWKSGYFWVVYAAQSGLAFDDIFWGFIDERFFGPNNSGVSNKYAARLCLLDEVQRQDMETFVLAKMQQKGRVYESWEPEEAFPLVA